MAEVGGRALGDSGLVDREPAAAAAVLRLTIK